MASVSERTPVLPETPNRPASRWDGIVLVVFLAFGVILAIVDHELNLHTMLVESVHAVVITGMLIFCLVWQQRYPTIRSFGWPVILWGLFFLALGSWIDILDDPPALAWLSLNGIPFGRTWEQAFLKKILGYTAGVGMLAYGFFRWVPWMIQTRDQVHALNTRLSASNRQLRQMLTGLEDHLESQRLGISRELHDDVAQQLTALKVELQLLQQQSPAQTDSIRTLGASVSDVLKSVRQISRNLRPESLYSLGLVPAVAEFLDRLRLQYPDVSLSLDFNPPPDQTGSCLSLLNDRQKLHVFRIIQESVRNGLRHAGAQNVLVSLRDAAQQLTVTITDDGRGLPWQQLPTSDALIREGHLGIAGLRERAAELNATLTMGTADKDHGCQVSLMIDREQLPDEHP
ncbi:MAG: sensor histidine kinase [Candidatus Melainabacteria bacterium]